MAKNSDDNWFRYQDSTRVTDQLLTSHGNRIRRLRKIVVVQFLIIAGLVAYIVLTR